MTDDAWTHNRWERPDPDGTIHTPVPSGYPAPRCTFCTGEIRDLSMGLVIWNNGHRDDRPFDGFHFAHKIECDSGQLAGDDYRSSLQFNNILKSQRALAGFLITAARTAHDNAPLTPELKRNIGHVIAILSALGIASIELDSLETWPDDIDETVARNGFYY